MKMLSKECLYLMLIVGSSCASANLEIGTLEVVHVLFRHGEKFPEMKITYPGDPHINMTFYPFAQGELNLMGRQTMYAVGHSLRKRYHKFLGEIYSSKMVEAWASPYPRCIYSMQLVMASLFPPSEVQKWNEHLNWQPTLYHTDSWIEDKFFRVILDKEFIRLYWETCLSNKAMQSMLEKYRPWLKYIEDHTGFRKECSRGIFMLYAVLVAEHEANLKLPEWSKPIFPEILHELFEIELQHQIYTKKLKRKVVGPFLQKIWKDTQNRIHGKSEKKFHLYAGHDVNIVHVLTTLGFMYRHVPSYGAHLAIEVHKIEGNHVFKLFYREGKHEKMKLLRNNLGEDHITLDRYKFIVDDIFNDDINEDFRNSASNSSGANFWILFLLLCVLFIRQS